MNTMLEEFDTWIHGHKYHTQKAVYTPTKQSSKDVKCAPRKKEGMADFWSEVVNAHISSSPTRITCIQCATYFNTIVQS